MGWFTRFSRFGDFHLVYGQEAQNSCGIASVMMCVFKVNKLKPGKKAVHVETEVYKAYDKHLAGSSVDDGYVYDGSVYTYAGLLADTLNDLNVGKWEAKNVGTTAVAQTIVDSVGKEYVGAGPIVNTYLHGYPIIVLVNWSGGMGGHFVVVDTVNVFGRRIYASVCDPWDADVHITPLTISTPFEYVAKKQKTSWSFGGKKFSYPSQSEGTVQGWVIRRVGD